MKLALGAGHRLDTPGKRCLASIDPNETREWVLNDRVCVKIEEKLGRYKGVEILRVDDRAGVKPISVAERNHVANEWGADLNLAIHHNAGIKGGTGGGMVAYRDPLATDEVTVWWHENLYRYTVTYTGLKGNRANPLATSSLQMLTGTTGPAVLLELGFMDSQIDTPIILTEEFAENAASGIVACIVDRWGLELKQELGDVSPWAREAAQWCVDKGIINGDGTGDFRWKDTLTKEQMAQLLFNFAGVLGAR